MGIEASELRVNIITSGREQLDNIAQALRAIEQQMLTTNMSVERFDALQSAQKGLLNEQAELHKKVAQAIKEQEEAQNRLSNSIKDFGEHIRQHLTTPLGTAYLSIGQLAEGLGPLGVAVAGGAGILAGLGIEAFESAKKLGELGTQINNISIRTGLSTQEVSLFSFAAKAAGSDIGSFEMAMKMFSRALADNSDEGKKAKAELEDMGIKAHNTMGVLKPTGELFLEISDALGKMSNRAEQGAAAQALFSRAGLELLPTLLKLRENLDFAVKHNVEFFSDAQKEQMEAYHKRVLLIEDTWSKIWHAIAGASVASAAFLIDLPGDNPQGFGGAQRGALAKMGAIRDAGNAAPGEQAHNLALGGASAFGNFPGEGDPTSGGQIASLIARGDKLIAGSLAGGPHDKHDLTAEISDARKAVAYDEGKLQDMTGSLPDASAAARQLLATDRARLATLLAQNQALEDQKKLLEFAKTTNDVGLSPVARIFTNLHMLSGGAGTDARAAAETAAFNAAGRENTKGQTEADKRNFEMNLKSDEYLQRQQDEANKAAGKVTIEAGKDFDKKVKDQEKFGLESMKQEFELRKQILELTGGPGGEIELANKLYALRIAQIKQEYELNHNENEKAFAEKQALNDLVIRNLEVQKRQLDEFKSEAGSLFDAGIKGIHSGGMGKWFQDQALGQAKTMFQNVAGMAEPSVMKMLPNFGPEAMHGLFKGTVLGREDPVTAAAKTTALATQGTWDNTTNILAILEAVTGATVPGAPAAASGISMPSFTKILGGGLGFGGGTSSGSAAMDSLTRTLSFGAPGSGAGGGGGMLDFSDLPLSGGATSVALASLGMGSASGGAAFPSSSSAASLVKSMATLQSSFGKNAMLGASNPFATLMGDSVSTGDGTATTGGALGAAGKIGAIGALTAAGYGIYQGATDLAKGGAYGVVGGIGKISGSIAAIDPEPISKAVLGSIALVSGVITAIMGDPRVAREKQEANTLKFGHFFDPITISASEGVNGLYSDMDAHGNVRSSPFSPFAPIQESFADWRNSTIVPGRTGNVGPGTTINNNYISAIDAASLHSFVQKHSDTFADGIVKAVGDGHTIIPKMRSALLG